MYAYIHLANAWITRPTICLAQNARNFLAKPCLVGTLFRKKRQQLSKAMFTNVFLFSSVLRNFSQHFDFEYFWAFVAADQLHMQ